MPNWTPKQALSGLTSKFRRSGSEESSSSSSADEAVVEAEEVGEDRPLGSGAEDVPVSPLAMMNENSPEAWLGQFLLKLEVPASTARGTLEGARRDEALKNTLTVVRTSASANTPLVMLEPGQAAALKKQDWAAWWRAQGDLLSYCYATLALSLLGSNEYVDDLRAMYSQESNLQVRRDAHYVLAYRLGKDWPAYQVTAGDFDRLTAAS